MNNKLDKILYCMLIVAFFIMIILLCVKFVAETPYQKLCQHLDYDKAILRPDKRFTMDCKITIYTPLEELLER